MICGDTDQRGYGALEGTHVPAEIVASWRHSGPHQGTFPAGFAGHALGLIALIARLSH